MKGNEDAIIILSEKEGLYYVGCLSVDDEEKIFKRLCETSCLLSYADLWLDCVKEEEKSLKVKL